MKDVGHLILILAGAQGYFLSVLIMHKHGKLYANRFLSLLMFLYSVILTHLFIGEIYEQSAGPLVWFILGLTYLIGPLHYLYAKHLVAPVPCKKDWLHIIPFVLFELLSFIVVWFPGDMLPEILVQKVFIDYTWYHWSILLHVCIYIVLTLFLIHRYNKLFNHIFSNVDKLKLVWLRNLTLLAIVIMLVFFSENVFLLYNIQLSKEFDLSSLIVAIYVYTIGYMGMLKSEIFSVPQIAESMKQLQIFNPRDNIKYEKSGLTSEKIKKYEKQLSLFMQNKRPFLDSELTLAQLAKMLGIPSHYLSAVINSRFEQNFFNFINQYRLEQVKKDLVDPEKTNLKILAIAFDAGFNSKSSFNQIFKNQLKMTPSEYRNRYTV